jgi:hypothetical protein
MLAHTLEEMVGTLMGHVVLGQPLPVTEASALAMKLQRAAATARAIEGGNVVPMPRPTPRLTEINA